MDMRSAEVAAKKGGIGEYVALSELLACLLLHSDRVAFSLLERPPVDGYADRLVRHGKSRCTCDKLYVFARESQFHPAGTRSVDEGKCFGLQDARDTCVSVRFTRVINVHFVRESVEQSQDDEEDIVF